MGEPVKLTCNDGVGVITVNNPPVNALSTVVRTGMLAHLKTAVADPDIKGLVLACAGQTFIAGADITEFGKLSARQETSELSQILEKSPKPIVASIHGAALGGGLELALICQFRVATDDAKLGLPEVKLGLLPGGGGTQRLPRAVGPELAVKMIVGGDPISAGDALKSGLIDEIVKCPEAGGEAFLRRILAEGRLWRRLCEDDSKFAAAKADRSMCFRSVSAMIKRTRGAEAPFAAAEALRIAIDLPFDDRLKMERQIFDWMLASDQSKPQRYAFFAERAARKMPDVSQQTPSRSVERVAVIGAGTMGTGIAMSFTGAGIPVTLIEINQEQLKRGMNLMQRRWDAATQRGDVPTDAPAKRMALIDGVVGLEGAKDADLIIEAVFESMALKKDVFGQLDKVSRQDAVFASNTSNLNIDEIANATTRPQNVLGTHFFSLANVTKLCEIVRGAKTSPEVLATAISITRKIGKIPVGLGRTSISLRAALCRDGIRHNLSCNSG